MVTISCGLEATEGLNIKYRCAHLYEGKNLRRNGLPFSTPGDFPYPGIESTSLASLTLTGRFFTTSTTWENEYTDMIMIYQTVNQSDTRLVIYSTNNL